MKDIYHLPKMDENRFVCSICNVELPAETCKYAAVIGCEVLQVGSNFIPAGSFDKSTMIKCNSKAAANEIQRAKDLESGFSLSEDQSVVGEVVRFPKLSNAEKMANRSGLANFFAFREATKPKGVDQ